jgi:hypothetical protein
VPLLDGEGNEVVFVGTEMLNLAQTELNSDSKAVVCLLARGYSI